MKKTVGVCIVLALISLLIVVAYAREETPPQAFLSGVSDSTAASGSTPDTATAPPKTTGNITPPAMTGLEGTRIVGERPAEKEDKEQEEAEQKPPDWLLDPPQPLQ
jgi:hypothetical protein